jgi:alkylation response protein AidB-like acyl-CoA dehydrogenase
MHLDTEDSQRLLEALGRFARERIAPMAAQPHQPIDRRQLALLTQEAGAMGILSLSTTESGFGLWEHCDTAPAMAFNTGALRHIAAASPGVAFAWHRQALARWVAVQLGQTLEADDLAGLQLVPAGHYGLARGSLARWLRVGALETEDQTMLADWLDRRTHTTTLYAPEDWKLLLWPVWVGKQVAWQWVHRPALSVRAEKAQHGLDELAGFSVSLAGEGTAIAMAPETSRILFAHMFTLDMLGLLAIGAGALDHGQGLARAYAAIRRQGGSAIAAHPAVQHMLSDIDIARHRIDMALAAFAQPVVALDAGAVAAARAHIAPALCHAANQVMQVHGGIGYMRDAGPEKLVRDQNMLKLASGGTRDLHAFLAGWTGTCA